MARKQRRVIPSKTEGKTVVRMKVPCGFCITDVHKKCKDEIVYYNTVWLCMCPCKERDGEMPVDDDEDANVELD